MRETLGKMALNSDDIKALLRGLAITMVAAGLTYLSENLGKIDFGQYTPLVVAILAFAVNIVRKLFDGVMPKITIER
jgi:hypothetical protein